MDLGVMYVLVHFAVYFIYSNIACITLHYIDWIRLD